MRWVPRNVVFPEHWYANALTVRGPAFGGLTFDRAARSALLLIPFAAFLSLVLSVGPHLQYYVFSFLHKDAASLYDSAFPEGLADFPSPSEWLFQGIVSWMTLPAIVITIISFKTLQFKKVVVKIWLSAFLVLSAMDLAIQFAAAQFSPDAMLINLSSNFAGAFLISALSACAIWTYESLALGLGPLPGKFVAPTSLLVWGIFVSLLSYSGFFVLYQPTPVRVDIMATWPVSGWISGKGSDKNEPTFTLLPTVSHEGRTTITSVKGQAAFAWRSKAKVLELSRCLRRKYDEGVRA
jgi:hypothetical protein